MHGGMPQGGLLTSAHWTVCFGCLFALFSSDWDPFLTSFGALTPHRTAAMEFLYINRVTSFFIRILIDTSCTDWLALHLHRSHEAFFYLTSFLSPF
jgi:hypothetical protein